MENIPAHFQVSDRANEEMNAKYKKNFLHSPFSESLSEFKYIFPELFSEPKWLIFFLISSINFTNITLSLTCINEC